MSCNSTNRDVYFRKYCLGAPDVTSYLDALRKSPYRTHQRAFKELYPQFKEMLAVENLKLQMEEK